MYTATRESGGVARGSLVAEAMRQLYRVQIYCQEIETGIAYPFPDAQVGPPRGAAPARRRRCGRCIRHAAVRHAVSTRCASRRIARAVRVEWRDPADHRAKP